MPDLLKLIPKRMLDPKAYTMSELCEKTGYDRTTLEHLRNKGLSDGTWVQVWKKPKGGRLQKAYRASIG